MHSLASLFYLLFATTRDWASENLFVRNGRQNCWKLLLVIVARYSEQPAILSDFRWSGLDEAAWATAGTDAIVNTTCGRKAATPPAWG